MREAMVKRVHHLEAEHASGRVRICWDGEIPSDVDPDATLIEVSWLGEGEDRE